MNEFINWFANIYPPVTVPLLFFGIAVIAGLLWWYIDNKLWE